MLNSPHPGEDSHFGQELILNLYDCDLAKISSGEEIKKFVIELCDTVIRMKRYGDAFIPHFGHDNPISSGYSLVQLIETSSVTAHFSEFKKSVYLNIFSCAWFDPEKTEEFCKSFFGAGRVESRLIKRE
ncbi:S-adenosylmethionine decarboxylase [Patescibacteria group bacterium]|nr:S-adenosylmethionine decarboxylase [Patescibacteria group bacterium]